MQEILTELCEEILENGLRSDKAQSLIKKAALPKKLNDEELTSEILYRLNMSILENSLFLENLSPKIPTKKSSSIAS